jgi:hypothetical protein
MTVSGIDGIHLPDTEFWGRPRADRAAAFALPRGIKRLPREL